MILIFLISGLANCQTQSPPLPTLPTESEASPAAVDQNDQVDSSLSPDAGRLAYIGGDGNVYVTTVDRATTLAITADATAAPEYPGLSYHRLSWAPDGQLAFAAVTRSGDAAQSTLYVIDAPGEAARIIGQSDEHFVIYMYWSPVPCPERPTCRRLAYLIEEGESISLRMVELDGQQVENRLAGVGWPFYFSWAPDGRHILWHTGGARRHNAEAQMALYDVERDQAQALSHPPGIFHAPAWSPQGQRWLGVSAQETTDHLQSFDMTDQPVTLATESDGQIAFIWSPQGEQVAYATRGQGEDPFYGPIHVVDLKTNEVKRVTDLGLRILAFFWSPDDRQLGYLTWVPLFDSVWMQWRVYNLAEHKDRGFKMFHPSFQMRFIISSFNQYAQSDRFWSPDGRYLVYADRDRQLVERVWLIDTWAETGAEAILVDEGSIGLWSWN